MSDNEYEDESLDDNYCEDNDFEQGNDNSDNDNNFEHNDDNSDNDINSSGIY